MTPQLAMLTGTKCSRGNECWMLIKAQWLPFEYFSRINFNRLTTIKMHWRDAKQSRFCAYSCHLQKLKAQCLVEVRLLCCLGYSCRSKRNLLLPVSFVLPLITNVLSNVMGSKGKLRKTLLHFNFYIESFEARNLSQGHLSSLVHFPRCYLYATVTKLIQMCFNNN